MRDSRFGGSDSPVMAAMGTVETPVDIELTRDRAEVEKWKAAAVAAHDGNELIQQMKSEVDEARAEVERLKALQRDDRQNAINAIEERDQAVREVERLRGALDGLAERWAEELAEDNTNGYGAGVEDCLDELRDVLRGDQ